MSVAQLKAHLKDTYHLGIVPEGTDLGFGMTMGGFPLGPDGSPLVDEPDLDTTADSNATQVAECMDMLNDIEIPVYDLTTTVTVWSLRRKPGSRKRL